MNTLKALLPLPLLCAAAIGQSIAVFPDEYAAVPEGPFNSPNLPLAGGTSRVQCLYEAIDLAIPSGHQITKLGFRQDGTLTTTDLGRTINVEIRMGYSTFTAANVASNFDNNYAAPPVTVYPQQNYTLPPLHDVAVPLPNGQFFITLTTPFTYAPAAGQNLIVEYRIFGNSGGGTQWNYRLDRADYYSVVTNGPAGCPHSGGGTPNLTVQPTRPGLSYSASVTSGPGSAPCVLAINLGTQLQPPYPLTAVFAGINPACMGQISPFGLATLGGTTGTTGSASWSFSIPNNPAYADYHITSQGLFLDFFAPGGLVVSRGVDVLTGANPRSTIIRGNGAPTTVTTGSISRNYCPVAFFEHQ
ncbi:MAG TPA: hypothetical protein VFZ65_04995 [Planctomycetota bacterium]|nr:hypothetical protein [Planctomycetota bacterium]